MWWDRLLVRPDPSVIGQYDAVILIGQGELNTYLARAFQEQHERAGNIMVVARVHVGVRGVSLQG